MKLELIPQDEGAHIQCSGRFTFDGNQVFGKVLDFVDHDNVHFLELDFANVDFIDSAGLGMLLLLRDACQKKNILLSINAVHGQVEKIFNLAKFNKLFTING